MAHIYRIYNKQTGKSYIGKSGDFFSLNFTKIKNYFGIDEI